MTKITNVISVFHSLKLLKNIYFQMHMQFFLRIWPNKGILKQHNHISNSFWNRTVVHRRQYQTINHAKQTRTHVRVCCKQLLTRHKIFPVKATRRCTYENLSNREGGERKREKRWKWETHFQPSRGSWAWDGRRENHTQSRGFTIILLLKNLWN